DRPALRDIVFNDGDAKQALENIIHPEVRQKLLIEADKSESPYCLLIVPLLLEANMLDLVDRILVVDISEQMQIERLRQRDKLTEQQAQSILNGQASRADRLQIADDVIENLDDADSLQQKVELLHHFYCELAVKYNASC
ncbi:dephospho-CoA kinase, partial [Methylophaga sp.]|uniref:dephospho-CoA kinase n=1 Tax=Methylophaga sp. TaxID=2024840 RepID=UPI003F6A178A